MVYFIELWKVKPEWKALSQEERAAYMGQVGGAIKGLMEQGTEILSWAKNDDNTSLRAPYDYYAIWGFPSQEIADGFQDLVEQAGWYNYFEQVNIKGKAETAEHTLGELIQL